MLRLKLANTSPKCHGRKPVILYISDFKLNDENSTIKNLYESLPIVEVHKPW